ncbi:hypothetical protein [Thalassobacter stenotrophicus]|uniref:Uncharacterized protein n=2 Tax=Thalassobacter stenotrophicus TaxID=266809 RepID=A0A0N7LSW3_9RHOB|nr:hypothetical protein [Thalassobacter stenotrophicus]CUH59018.1 hypothetical protein THS5294_00298 [Thalassobacter stenotrophicus]SHJ02738.1 hypothetical protein SAMN02744035_02347 [Thalassobacter stenotrophicus DSM 16310]
MKHIHDGYRGLSLFFGLNADRFLSVLMVGFALLMATYFAALM